MPRIFSVFCSRAVGYSMYGLCLHFVLQCFYAVALTSFRRVELLILLICITGTAVVILYPIGKGDTQPVDRLCFQAFRVRYVKLVSDFCIQPSHILYAIDWLIFIRTVLTLDHHVVVRKNKEDDWSDLLALLEVLWNKDTMPLQPPITNSANRCWNWNCRVCDWTFPSKSSLLLSQKQIRHFLKDEDNQPLSIGRPK